MHRCHTSTFFTPYHSMAISKRTPLVCGTRLSRGTHSSSDASSSSGASNVGLMLPQLVALFKQRFPRISSDAIDDAVAAAIERYFAKAPPNVRASDASAFAWLRTTTMHELFHTLRAARRYVPSAESERILSARVANDDTDRAARERILREWLVRLLGADVAETVWLHDVERLPPRDIAQTQHLSVTSVKARIARSRKILRHASHHIS
jgi:RNA polymerase sigma factor (sigma-70 family)